MAEKVSGAYELSSICEISLPLAGATHFCKPACASQQQTPQQAPRQHQRSCYAAPRRRAPGQIAKTGCDPAPGLKRAGAPKPTPDELIRSRTRDVPPGVRPEALQVVRVDSNPPRLFEYLVRR